MDNTSVGMRDLGQNVSRVLARVKEGESLVVTEHGRPVARLVPYTTGTSLDEMIASGEVTPPSGNLQEFLARHKPVESEILGSKVLQEMRDEEQW
ncbi:MAG: type II toxin-antitoxin system prevent-host-death family antitoxin [Pontimonas sp.]